VPPTDCVCFDAWFVGAEFHESACECAEAFWFAELGPAVTPPAEIVTGALPFTGVCCTAEDAADSWAATAAWMDAWSAPAPPFPAAATAGTATAAATVATNAMSVRFITPPLVVVQERRPASRAADQPIRGVQPGRQVGRTIRRGLAGRRGGARRTTTSWRKNRTSATSATTSGGTGDPPPAAAPAEVGTANGIGIEGRSKGIGDRRGSRDAPGGSGAFRSRRSGVAT
jgi:hypothetical protein